MWSQNKTILSLLLLPLLGIPIYFTIVLGQAAAGQDWEGLQFNLDNYLMGIWTAWVFMVSVAVYYKWAKKKNFLFAVTYPYLAIVFGLFVYFNIILQRNLHQSTLPYVQNNLNLIGMVQHLLLIIAGTVYVQLSVWWFEKKRHRR